MARTRQEFLRCYYWIKRFKLKNIDDNENVFDVVAGTSIGAINAAFLVSYVIKRRREERKIKFQKENAFKMHPRGLICLLGIQRPKVQTMI